MTLYKIIINDRNYASWNVFIHETIEPVTVENFNPERFKLFNNDVFTYDGENVNIIHSSIRNNENIPAVIIFDNNKTYGRENKMTNKKQHRLLYKCIPDDTRLPVFLVPFEIKQMNCSKVYKNV
jgi:transketolase